MKPNIFNYATSELSQDAVICWMIAWINSEDTIMKEFSCDFIKKMLKLCQNSCLDSNTLVKVDIKRQYYNIDVLVSLYFDDGTIQPLIFEDKTYTLEHENQLKKYYDIILKKNKGNEKILDPVGIYYKSGFIYDYESVKVEMAGYKVFTRTMMLDLMKKYIGNVQSDIFNNYYDYLTNIELKEVIIENTIDANDMANMGKVLDTNEGQWMLMKKMFGITQKPYCWSGTSHGRPWTQWVILEQFEKEGLCDSIFYRLDRRAEGYYLSVKQYLNEVDAIIIQDKMQRLDRLKICFDKAFENTKSKGISVLDAGKISNRGSKECDIGVFFINERNTFKRIIEFIPVFNEIFKEEIQREFKIKI
jgi:hypothetical protein